MDGTGPESYPVVDLGISGHSDSATGVLVMWLIS